MIDDEWEKQRQRSITDGGSRPGSGQMAPSEKTSYTKALRVTRAAVVASGCASILNAVVGFWHPWYFAVSAVMLSSALVWHRVHRLQRQLYGIRR